MSVLGRGKEYKMYWGKDEMSVLSGKYTMSVLGDMSYQYWIKNINC